MIQCIIQLLEAIGSQHQNALTLWAVRWGCPLQASGKFADRVTQACRWACDEKEPSISPVPINIRQLREGRDNPHQFSRPSLVPSRKKKGRG